MQPDSDDVISLLFSGHLWPHRTRLDEAGIQGTYTDVGGKQVYLRVLKQIDVSGDEGKEKVKHALTTVFSSLAIRTVVDPDAEEGSSVEDFVNELKEMGNLHFCNTRPDDA